MRFEYAVRSRSLHSLRSQVRFQGMQDVAPLRWASKRLLSSWMLAGIIAAMLGGKVVATDLEGNLPLLRKNIAANGVTLHTWLLTCLHTCGEWCIPVMSWLPGHAWFHRHCLCNTQLCAGQASVEEVQQRVLFKNDSGVCSSCRGGGCHAS